MYLAAAVRDVAAALVIEEAAGPALVRPEELRTVIR